MEHKHIKFHEGHITWTGKNKPSEEIMEAFEALYEFVKNNGKAIEQLRKTKQDIPAIYGPPPVRSQDITDLFKVIKHKK